MKIKLVMSPVETELLAIYERLNALNEERLRARYVRSLLTALIASPSLPDWFNAITRRAFESHRSKSIRLSLDHRDPALSPLLTELEPLNHAQRVIQIKRLLRMACVDHAAKPESATPLLRPTTAVALSPVSSPEEHKPISQLPTTAEEEAIRKQSFRFANDKFFTKKTPPIHPV